MARDRFYEITSVVLLAFLGYLTYEIFQPFLTAMAWAVVFCVIFYPAYGFILKYVRLKTLASFITLIVIIIVIAGPFSYIAISLVSEISSFVAAMSANDSGQIKSLLSDPSVSYIVGYVSRYAGIEGNIEEVIVKNARHFGELVISKLIGGFTNVLSVAVNFFLMLFVAFFFLKDGNEFLSKIKEYFPFPEQQKERLAGQMKDMIVSTIYGGVIVALVQGILGGVAFSILKINSPVLWGSVMAISSFIPMVGTAIVWIPASLIFFANGLYIKGIILILIGVFVISMADNILKPMIIGGRTKMPTVVIFFTVIGGIKLFGLLGLVMGPLVFALFVSVFEMFRTLEKGGTNA